MEKIIRSFLSFIVTLFVIMLGPQSFASDQTCIARKSIAWLDSDDHYKVRKAETTTFKVVSIEHEDPYTLEFKEKDGTKWDNVEIMTGTLTATPEGDIFQVVAQIKSANDEVVSRLSLVGDKESKFARAITTIDLANTDRDPSLTIECRLTP